MRPKGSALGSPLRTDERRCTGTSITEHAMRQPVQPKPEEADTGRDPKMFAEWVEAIVTGIDDPKRQTASQIIENIKKIANKIKDKKNKDEWLSEKGQEELMNMLETPDGNRANGRFMPIGLHGREQGVPQSDK